MATQAEVIALRDKGKSNQEIADKLGIQVNGVYGHIRRFEQKVANGGTLNGALNAAPSIPLPSPMEGSPIEDIKARIADTVEHLEAELALRRAEIGSLEGQHGVLLKTLQGLTKETWL